MHAPAPRSACRQQGRLTVTTVATLRQARAAAALIAEYRESTADGRGRNPSFTSPPGILLVARDGSTTVGVVGVRRNCDATAELTQLYVRPWARRLGVGDALLRGALLAARRLGTESVVAEADPTRMAAALRVCRRAGFVDAAPRRIAAAPGMVTLQRPV
jgi:ribosomal protein S18 acetylase RimI-like enzyme